MINNQPFLLINIPVDTADKDRSAGDIAQSRGNKIGKQKIGHGDRCTVHHAQRNEKHIGDAVFITDCHKTHYREKQSQQPARDIDAEYVEIDPLDEDAIGAIDAMTDSITAK